MVSSVVEPVGAKLPLSCPALLNPVPVTVKVSPVKPTETDTLVILALAPSSAVVVVLLQAMNMTSKTKNRNSIFFINKSLDEVIDGVTAFSTRHGLKADTSTIASRVSPVFITRKCIPAVI